PTHIHPPSLHDALPISAVQRTGFTDVRADVEELPDPWLVTEEGLEARLDAIGAPGHPSRRQRWQSRYRPDEVEALVAHMKSQVGDRKSTRLNSSHEWIS